MALPGNGIFVVRGEMSTLMTAMKRSRYSTSYQEEEQDGLLKLFIDLKLVLSKIEDLRLIDPIIFLGPFLEVIRTEETTGAVTSLALAAVNKFLSYGLIDPTHPSLASTVENIADAVTHARFMGTDQASDGVTLMRVVEVLHTLMRSPEGSALTNENVCEVMLSCFKICFEPRLNELLRRTAEQALKDMVLLLFMRLPQFSDDIQGASILKKLMVAGPMDQNSSGKRKKSKSASSKLSATVTHQNTQPLDTSKNNINKSSEEKLNDPQSPPLQLANNNTTLKVPPLATTPATPAGNILDMQGKITQTPISGMDTVTESEELLENDVAEVHVEQKEGLDRESNNESITSNDDQQEPLVDEESKEETGSKDEGEYINSVGVRFTHHGSTDVDGNGVLLPYGLPCIQELFRFLILLCNPLDKQNTDTMMHMGLSLLTVAFEVAADNIGKYDTLLSLVKDDLCRNLFSLLQSERLTIFAADIQLCFLIFESLRTHLKFQLEAYLTKLSEIIVSENPRTPYEMRELSLDNILQLWRIPGFVAELYINYDCDLYCSDLFENLTKLLSKSTLSATSSVYSIHILSMEALITVVENIERNCVATKSGCSIVPASSSNRHSRQSSTLEGITIDNGDNNEALNENDETNSIVENISSFIKRPERHFLHIDASKAKTKEELLEIKNKKRILTQGTELFNQRPDKGIQFLQENGLLNPQLDPMEVALFLRENSGLDKKMIGEYISKKKNVESKILENFVESFDFKNTRIDQALRMYLETFRLPGEAPLIFLVMEHFADHWSKQNDEPFANTDAAFRLAYAIIMLNMDQHNYNAKRLNVPMTSEDFCKNLRGLNGNKDFDQDMLLNIFNAIKNEEIVMPAEQTGIVKENYMWKVLLRRGNTKDGFYHHVQDAVYDSDLFNIVWGSALAALSFMFDKSSESGYHRTLNGFSKCAAISAYYSLHQDFDALILTLCKFSTLLNIQLEGNDIQIAVQFGLNTKAKASIRTVFSLVHEYGDCLREGWKNILEIIIQLFRLKLLPKSLIEVEDFCLQSGKATLILEKRIQKQEPGLFSSLYSYLSSEGQREPSYEEQEIIKISKKCIKDCQIDQIIQESKFIQYESLQELLKCLLELIKAPSAHKSVGLPYSEDIVVFWMEFLVKIVIQNRDRMLPLWNSVRDQFNLLLVGSSSCGYDYLLNRTTVALLKLAIYLMRNEELCPIILQSLNILLRLKPNVIYRISKQISSGIYELLKTSAQNIHTEADWQIIFTTLECVGAGTLPPEFDDIPHIPATKSDGALSSEEDSGLPDRGYISDSEIISKSTNNSNSGTPHQQHGSPTTENWILVNKDSGEFSLSSRPQSPLIGVNSLVYPCKLVEQMPFALFKCWDSLAFIVRNVAHITPYNFESCVRCIRTFVEACLDGGLKARRRNSSGKHLRKKSFNRKDLQRNRKQRNQNNSGNGIDDQTSDSEDEDLNQRFEQLSIQLLDLMYTLYTRTAQIFRWWAEEGCAVPQCSALWAQGWCPLLQGIARFAMDCRREVRTYAISCLQQRALLVHDLQTLTGTEWASCFRQVLFPLLNELLPESSSIGRIDQSLLEESRIRTATIMSKVFLHHLTPLIELPTFNEVWIEILDYIEKFMKVGSDMLYEQMLEILKNMLLVMHSVKIFHSNDNSGEHSILWDSTWKRIGEFLPELKAELFKENDDRVIRKPVPHPGNFMIEPSVEIMPNNNANKSLELVVDQNLTNEENNTQNLKSCNTNVPTIRSSIILQPPADTNKTEQPVIFGQDVASKQIVNVPLFIPQAANVLQSLNAHSITVQQNEFLNNFKNNQINTTLSDSPARMYTSSRELAGLNSMLPDLVSDTSKTVQNSTIVENSSETISISKTESSPIPIKSATVYDTHLRLSNFDIQNDLQQHIDVEEGNSPVQFTLDSQNKFWSKSTTGTQQPVFQSYHQQEHSHKNNLNDGSYYQRRDSLIQQQQQEQLSQQNQTQQKHHNYEHDTMKLDKLSSNQDVESSLSPRVPISHLITGNQYPSLNRIPPASIVQSFTPIYVPHDQNIQTGNDIYYDYVQNPYNLTLQSQQPQATNLQKNDLNLDLNNKQHQQQNCTTTDQPKHGQSIANAKIQEQQSQNQQQQQSPSTVSISTNVFQTANYFSEQVDPSTIPPGSEVLFGQP
ncbi:Golgi-specific brefeldin A-resistance guanine nucleotide exchange factor 1 isoform X2 [Condylostylus longicornis]|uniref:Golgi-specific brefeldin A-resistance guanine nucleotide exchange factor 1 isoform X2 n=1 Tax=Condylostylus longicornis TaxID=2530218 RepID=UPI00244E5438|nr:Golgi-specific brefeldin A-resistance guanine nucleotide exchange factor 1 isoform X2 [Condylostylus longicornis]